MALPARPYGNPTGADRLFKTCAHCGLTRLMSWYGRRWLCDGCAREAGLNG